MHTHAARGMHAHAHTHATHTLREGHARTHALRRDMHAHALSEGHACTRRHALCKDVALVVVQSNLKEVGVTEVLPPRTEHPALRWGNMHSQPVARGGMPEFRR